LKKEKLNSKEFRAAMYLLSTVSQQVVPVFVFESQLEANAKLYAEHYQSVSNSIEQRANYMTEDIHDLKEYHSSNRSSPESPDSRTQGMTHYTNESVANQRGLYQYDSEMTSNEPEQNPTSRNSPVDKMGEVIHITHSDEDEDIDVGDHVSVGDQHIAVGDQPIRNQPIGVLPSSYNRTQPQRQSVIVSLEDYARNQSYAPIASSSYESHEMSGQISHEMSRQMSREMSHDVDMNTQVKIEPEYITKDTVELHPIKTEPSDQQYEPEIDQSLSPFTPANSLRPIEEHNQYRGNDPDQRDRQYRCGFCHKVFRRKEEKKRHENSHLNIRSHKCKVCSKTFMRADHRNSHEKTHNKEKEFNCKICNKSFRRADEHKRHMTRQIHLRNVQRAKVAAQKTGSSSGIMHL
jgi:hypothetical protein